MVVYKEFRVGDLFEFTSIRQIPRGFSPALYDAGGYPYITQKATNNGVTGFMDEVDELELISKPMIIMGVDNIANGVCYWMDEPFYANKMIGISNTNLNRRSAQYIITALLSAYKGYSYTDKISKRIVEDTWVELPSTAFGTPDFVFMENYIKEIEQKHIKKLESDLATRTENLLTVIGREDLVGDPDGLAAVVDKGFDDSGVEYAEFYLNDLFAGDDITKGRRIKQSDREPGDIMLITAGMENYGVSGYIEDHIAHCDGECITIDMFGNVFYRPDEFFFDDNIVVYKNKRYDRYTYMYLASALGYIVNRFGYGNQFRASKADDVVLTLPITPTGQLDFDFMEQYIAHIELKFTHTLMQWSKAKELL